MKESRSVPASQSRRSFLGKLSLGLLSLVGASMLLRSTLLGSNNKVDGSVTEFPGPDSIFHPQSDPRLDPRRKS